jgi:ADP-heptose:LPS heptosyltransferase|tara:strand:- start:2709 stop:3683 length:975 start_codon:yes stop_codon:yes gene_type:complete
MKILIYSFNDKIGDGLQKITFIQKLKQIYPDSYITYTTTQKTTLKNILNSLIKDCIDEFIEFNDIDSSFFKFFKENKSFVQKQYDLIIDLQKVVIRSLKLKKISHKNFFSTSLGFLLSDYKNKKKYDFKNIYIERFYFNILSLLTEKYIDEIPNIKLPSNEKSKNIIKTEKKLNIAIAPGAGNKIRQWHISKYIEIGKYLRGLKYNVYFFLGPEEKEYIEICHNDGFICPEWSNGKMLYNNDILFTMSLAKMMSCILCNDGGTSWMFEFAGVKSLKIFGVTNEKKFARPNYCKTIQVSDYGYQKLNDFPVEDYRLVLDNFLKTL